MWWLLKIKVKTVIFPSHTMSAYYEESISHQRDTSHPSLLMLYSQQQVDVQWKRSENTQGASLAIRKDESRWSFTLLNTGPERKANKQITRTHLQTLAYDVYMVT